MIKYYDKKPKIKEINNWVEKYKSRYPEKFKPTIMMELEPEDVFDGSKRFFPVDQRFKNEWEFRRKFPLGMIIFGLFLLILQMIT